MLTVLLMSALTLACASRVHTHGMSTDEHLLAAEEAEQAASEHEGAYDPSAVAEPRQADPKPCGNTDGLYGPCWTDARNPTARHLAHASKLRRAAKAHRKAATALQQAEATACASLSENDRDISPFAHTDDFRVDTVLDNSILVVFRRVPGMTREGLAKHIECHLARAASLGHAMPEMDYCPLVPHGISATVAEFSDGFEVVLRASDPEASADLRIRAQRLRDRAAGKVSAKVVP